MENCIKTVKEIDRTHDGLGIYVMLNQLCVNSNKSIFNVGSSGIGKKVIINTVKTPLRVLISSKAEIKEKPNVRDAKTFSFDMKWDTMKLTSLVNTIGFIENKSLLWRIEEFSTLLSYHRELFLKIGSKIITDKSFIHDMGTAGNRLLIDIRNCDLCMIIGIQPITLSDLINSKSGIYWEALGKDRFLKIIILNPLRKKEVEPLPDFKPTSTITKNYDNMPERPLILSKIIGNQVSEGRISSWCRDLLKSYMSYEDYERYSIKYELEFIKLFGEIIKIYNSISWREDLSQPVIISGGALMMLEQIAKNFEGISITDLAETFRIYNRKEETNIQEYRERIIRKYASILLSSKLIKKIENSPIKYQLSDNLIRFYDFYRGLVK